MKEQLLHLDNLLECVTSYTSSKSFSELNRILEKYTKILDYVNAFDESYKRASSVYYNGINLIRDNIQISLYADADNIKETAFEDARNQLKKDIQALATLIRPEQELVAVTM